MCAAERCGGWEVEEPGAGRWRRANEKVTSELSTSVQRLQISWDGGSKIAWYGGSRTGKFDLRAEPQWKMLQRRPASMSTTGAGLYI